MKLVFFIIVMLMHGCSGQFSEQSEVLSEVKYPRLDTYGVHCSGAGRNITETVVQDSALQRLPQSDFVSPLDQLLVTSRMECRYGVFHNGVDFAGVTGSPIASIADGKVIYAGKKRLTGYTVILFHPQTGLESTYGHASENLVRKGDSVRAGQPIQSLGNSGQSTGPHLHLSISYQGAYVNPCALLQCR